MATTVAKKTIAKKSVPLIIKNSDINHFNLTEQELNEFCEFIRCECDSDAEDNEDCDCGCGHEHFIIRTSIDNYDLNYVFINGKDQIIVTINLYSSVNYTNNYERNILLGVLTIDCRENNTKLKEFLKNFHYICSSEYVEIIPFDWKLVAKANLPKLSFFDSLHKQILKEKINKIGRKLTRKSFSCCVCQEEISERQKTKCNHGLCFYCYYKLENKTCPVCRTNIKLQNYH